jgi:hypothetical protein
VVYPSSIAFFDGGPPLLVLRLDCRPVALGGTLQGLLPAPADLPEQTSDMVMVIAHPEGAPEHLRDPLGSPHVAAKANSILVFPFMLLLARLSASLNIQQSY